MPKLTFDEALERINDEQPIERADVTASALRRKVWQSANGNPGCMYDSSGVNMTKADAIASCVQIAGEDEKRGMKAALARDGVWYDENGYMYRVDQMTLDDLF